MRVLALPSRRNGKKSPQISPKRIVIISVAPVSTVEYLGYCVITNRQISHGYLDRYVMYIRDVTSYFRLTENWNRIFSLSQAKSHKNTPLLDWLQNCIQAGAVGGSLALQLSHMQIVWRDFQIEYAAFRLDPPVGGLFVQLFSWLKTFPSKPHIRQSDQDTMIITAVEL